MNIKTFKFEADLGSIYVEVVKSMFTYATGLWSVGKGYCISGELCPYISIIIYAVCKYNWKTKDFLPITSLASLLK